MPHRVENPGSEDQLGVRAQPRSARACAPGDEWSYGNEPPVPARNTGVTDCVFALFFFFLRESLRIEGP